MNIQWHHEYSIMSYEYIQWSYHIWYHFLKRSTKVRTLTMTWWKYTLPTHSALSPSGNLSNAAIDLLHYGQVFVEELDSILQVLLDVVLIISLHWSIALCKPIHHVWSGTPIMTAGWWGIVLEYLKRSKNLTFSLWPKIKWYTLLLVNIMELPLFSQLH